MSEEEIIKQINNVIYDLNAVNEDWYTIDEIETAKEQVKYIQGLLDLYNKQKEEIQSLTNQLDFIGEQNKYINRLEYEIKKKDAYIEELENWTKEHPSVIPMPKEIREETEKLGHFADLVTIEEKEYISKDKIRKKLLEPIKEELSKLGETFMNKAPEILTRSFEVEGTAMQELSWAKGRIEELLEEK